MNESKTIKPIVITDSCCGWEDEYAQLKEVPIIRFSYIFAGREYPDSGNEKETSEFYQRLINGEECTTSQATSENYYTFFQEYLSQERPIIYIAVSSLLSASYFSACQAKKRIMQENPQADITIIDSKAVCCGMRLLVEKAVDLRDEGKSKKDIVRWLQDHKLTVHLWLALDNFEHLVKGGRVSPGASFLCNLINRKSILKLDKKGCIVPVGKCRKEKKLFKKLAKHVRKEAINPKEQTAVITHAFCLERAALLKEMLLEKVPFKDVQLCLMPAVVAAHTGPSGLLLGFFGKKRS
ncbi:MAG: DegV family protein [Bacillota bacterium]|jgi:DegV family protein with EDD domain